MRKERPGFEDLPDVSERREAICASQSSHDTMWWCDSRPIHETIASACAAAVFNGRRDALGPRAIRRKRGPGWSTHGRFCTLVCVMRVFLRLHDDLILSRGYDVDRLLR